MRCPSVARVRSGTAWHRTPTPACSGSRGGGVAGEAGAAHRP
ncbi:hypothetical protein QJS66_07530 [Kocuria rhizophila]|nr:hypothetical protein QJS66_07530 [Kocuria rhizophila]